MKKSSFKANHGLIPFLCEAAPNSLKLLSWRSWRSWRFVKKLNAFSYRIGMTGDKFRTIWEDVLSDGFSTQAIAALCLLSSAHNITPPQCWKGVF
ncbi:MULTISPECIES: hypothetical protein [unclassified Nostoc]|uniref:hypothetical protein n=1 Tax=unclassified Nostoc TaxID=2593658 RepID=UPI002AD1FE13|nr:hypothetical protein [Nostoc sp. DedQUE03]MDZ7973316.1 hypothetical protein [Nostoc sp. DedQUE03]MDZ8049575.1 hypothetical protein [Nostoc sp. DedQUE02]